MALTQKQKLAITAYLLTGCAKTACKKAKVTEQTWQHWKNKDEEFKEELKKQQDNVYNASLDKLKGALPDAVDKLKDLLVDEQSSIQLRAACALLDYSVKLVENKELKERIEALEANITQENKK